jgi:hypothetical protein
MIISILGLIIFGCLYFNLFTRIQKCEQLLEQLKAQSKKEQSLDNHNSSPPPPPILSPDVPQNSESKSKQYMQTSVKPASKTLKQQGVKQKTPKKPFKIPDVIKENWIGVFGSVALVIGAVFFGLTSEIMQHAEARVGAMMGVSFLFLGISQKLKNYASTWRPLCAWLRSIAGTVILFTTLGAGGIEGIQFINSPLLALCFLCFGISINMLLAMATSSQAIASLHVILSIIAFCMAPQAPILLPIGALIASVGLIAAYRSKWDLHLLLIVIAFAFQNTFWTMSLTTQLLPWMHYLAIATSLVISLIAACIHYSKKYNSPKIEVLPLVAHISNWGLLTWNIWLHAQFFKWTPFILGAVALAGFIIARIAKKRGILWLYYTDTLLSHTVAIAAIASMNSFLVRPLDLSLLVLVEMLAFNFVYRFQKEDFLLRVGYLFQYIGYTIVIFYTMEALSTTSNADKFPIYLRMAVVVALSWSFHIAGKLKNFAVDDLRFVLSGEKDQKDPTSTTVLFGTLFFIGIYFFGFTSLVIQAIVLPMIGLIALWRKFKEDYSWNISLITSLIIIHALQWNLLATLLQHSPVSSIISRIDFLGLLLLDVILIFGNFLQFKLWKKNLHDFVTYALAIQLGLLTYVFTKEISLLLPGIIFLILSLLSLEVGRLLPIFFKYTNDVRKKIREGMTHVGLVFLIAFISRFVTVHLQVDPIWHGFSLRWGTELLGLLTIFYWISFYPRKLESSKLTQFCGDRLIEACLGFITLCVAIETPEAWRPSIWSLLAIGLLIGTIKKQWPKRLFVYSWAYLVASIAHVAFVTSSLTMPSLFAIETHNIPVFVAIFLQLCYAYITHKPMSIVAKRENSSLSKGIVKFIPFIYSQPSLSILLPVFLGLALLFAFNFEKTILTLLWVGLTCVYLAIGLFVKSKRSIQIAMSTLAFCSIRLIVFDLVQSTSSTQALVFIGVGSLMLGISVLYKKYKHRIK